MIVDKDWIPVLIKVDGKEESILCNLSKANFPQSALDLNFDEGTKVAFFTTGQATVHLTGKGEMRTCTANYCTVEQ